MLRQLERVLKLDGILRSHARPTAGVLAGELEVSERTVRADIAFLKDRLQAPIQFSKAQGFHYTDPDWRLPSIPLTQGELFALTLGARMLAAYAGSAYRSQLQSAIEQLAERIPEQAWVDLQQLAQERILFRVGAELDLDPHIWQVLEQACQQQRRVWIRYATPGKPISERELDPYVLHFSRSNPYVTGWCHLRGEPRWFRVDRIRQIQLLDHHFEVDSTFDREAHLESAFQHEVGGIPQEVVIGFDSATAPYIRERRWHPTQQIEEHPDGTLTLRLVVRGLNEVKRWVLFFAGAPVCTRSRVGGMKQKPESVQVRVRIPVSLLPKIEQIRVATGLFYPGEVLLLVFQWFLADAPRPTDKDTACRIRIHQTQRAALPHNRKR